MKIIRLSKLFVYLAFAITFSSQTNAQAYSWNDARYVTTSKNIDVLGYIVCLHNSFNQQPRRMSTEVALDNAARACRSEAGNLPRGRNQPSIQSIKSFVLKCGFTEEEGKLLSACNGGSSITITASAPDTIYPSPEVIEVGKWTEGISYGNGYLWVAESGQRTTAQIDLLSRNIVNRYRVGRLPTATVTTDNGNAYSLVATDKKIISHFPNQRIGELAQLRGCPEKMVSNNNRTLWVLGQPDCSSGTSSLTRIDTRSGRVRETSNLGGDALETISFGNEIWISYSKGNPISIVNHSSMRLSSMQVRNADLWALTKDDNFIYGGGRPANNSTKGVVVKINPNNRSVVARTQLPEMVVEITTDGFATYALSANGTIWILSNDKLDLIRTIEPQANAYSPKGAIVADGQLIVSVQQYKGENGAIFIFDDLLLDAQAQPNTNKPINRPVNKPTNVNPNIGQFPAAAVSLGGKLRLSASISAAQVGSTGRGSKITLLENTQRYFKKFPWFKVRTDANQIAYQWGGGICMNDKLINGVKGFCPKPPKTTNNTNSNQNSVKKPNSTDVVIGILDIFSQIIQERNKSNQPNSPVQLTETNLDIRPGSGLVATDGSVDAKQLIIYSVEGKKGQLLTVELQAKRGRPVFQIFVDEARDGGITLAGAGKDDNATVYRGVLPKTGVYKIVVGSLSGPGAFRLTTSIERRTGGGRYDTRNDQYIGTYISPTSPTGNIERNGNSIMWTDFNGRSFGLTADHRRKVLVTNTNPKQLFTLKIRRGNVVGFRFGRHQYTLNEDTILPSVAPKINSCHLRGNAVSTSIREGAKATFVNKGRSDIFIYWISYSGEESNYRGGTDPFISLIPGQLSNIDTRVGFAFLVVDQSGNCIDVVNTDKMKNRFEFLNN